MCQQVMTAYVVLLSSEVFLKSLVIFFFVRVFHSLWDAMLNETWDDCCFSEDVKTLLKGIDFSGDEMGINWA